ncbi:MAG: glucan biosynthesis protein, partial [Shewanella sp.]
MAFVTVQNRNKHDNVTFIFHFTINLFSNSIVYKELTASLFMRFFLLLISFAICKQRFFSFSDKREKKCITYIKNIDFLVYFLGYLSMVSLLCCPSSKPYSSLICSLTLGAVVALSGVAYAEETKPAETPVVIPPKVISQPATKNQIRFTKTGTFDSETVVKIAKRLAAKPYVALKDPLPAGLAKLSYDEYRDIRFNPTASIWRDQGVPFQMQMFHRGFYFQDLIEIAIVEGQSATHLAYEPKYFTAGEV